MTAQSERNGGGARRLHIRTYGCQMNVYDSERIAELLAPHGYRLSERAEDADLVVLNTCHIREKAAEKVYSELGRLRGLRESRKAESGEDLRIAVAGCVAQAEGQEMLARAPFVDVVVGPQAYHRLPELLAQVEGRPRGTGARGVVDTDFPAESKFDRLPEERTSQGPAAFLSVQEGCDKFCTFCVVPYTRGAEVSRPVADLLAEAGRLVASGAREITLLGQNVNAYHGEGPAGRTCGLAELLHRLAGLEGLERLRYTTSHPRDMDEALIRAHGEIPALMPFLHLPVQSGSDRVLEAMNRRHDAATYRRVVERLRVARPDLALSSDFIVGFPGETAEDFARTLALVAEVGFAQAYSFKYSPRPGTPAAALPGQVPEAEKAERLETLQQLLNAQQQAFNQGFLDRSVPVLLERRARREGQLAGRSPHMQAVHVAAPARLLGEIVDVRVRSAGPNSLEGTVATLDETGQRTDISLGASAA